MNRYEVKTDMKIYSFEPIADENCKVLILGTMPSVVSLECSSIDSGAMTSGRSYMLSSGGNRMRIMNCARHSCSNNT